MWAHHFLQNSRNNTKRGFTIVELLIVVVVIAILAAITIVAYNGIQNRAKASASQTASAQAAKKLSLYAVDNSDQYPATEPLMITATGLVEATGEGAGMTQGSTYQYSVSTDKKTYCLTTTTNGLSYRTSNSQPTPVKGACAGHGADGVIAIENLVTNPSVETDLNTWTAPFGAWNTIIPASAPQSGASSLRIYRNAASSDTRMGRHQLGTLAVGSYIYSSWVFVPDTAIGSIAPAVVFNGSVGTTAANTSTGGIYNQWRRVSVPFTITTAGNVYIEYIGGANQVGSIFIDSAMLSRGTTLPAYADGSSAGWDWTGTPNASTSTGPAL